MKNNQKISKEQRDIIATKLANYFFDLFKNNPFLLDDPFKDDKTFKHNPFKK